MASTGLDFGLVAAGLPPSMTTKLTIKIATLAPMAMYALSVCRPLLLVRGWMVDGKGVVGGREGVDKLAGAWHTRQMGRVMVLKGDDTNDTGQTIGVAEAHERSATRRESCEVL